MRASQLTRTDVMPEPALETKTSTDAVHAWLHRFEQVYRAAETGSTRVPWSRKHAHPLLITWLDGEGREMMRPGCRVAVVGCGYGHDAVALAERGYDVCAFDVSTSAVLAAQRIHPEYSGMFRQADLLDLPTTLLHRFDLLVDVHTLQSLPRAYMVDLACGMASLIRRRGLLLSIQAACDVNEAAPDTQPPFRMTSDELLETLNAADLHPCSPVAQYLSSDGTEREIRGLFGLGARTSEHG